MALSPSVISLSNHLIDKYASGDHLVEVAPGRNSSLSFVWDDGYGNYVYLDVGPNDTVHLFYDVVGQPKWEGVSVATNSCILDHLALAFQFLHPHFDLPQSRPILIGASNNVGYLRAA